MQDHRKLEIWQRAMDYAVAIYEFSALLPEGEKYNLISQIRRAATSIPLNISEGAGCNTNREFIQLLWYAYRSAKEVTNCLELAERLRLCTRRDMEKLLREGDEICAMIYSFIQKLKRSPKN